MAKFISLDNLSRVVSRFRAMFVAKEYRTGSTTDYKVLSDNNLTDELKERIESAGDSSFTGAYSDLTGKPSIAGHEVASGDQTPESLGLEAAGAAAAARTGAVDDVKKLGYQTAENVDEKVSAAKTELQNQLGSAFRPKGSSAFADLPTSGRAIGDVWNVTDDFTTTDAFVEGEGKRYPAGTNVVLVNAPTGEGDATTPKWDALSGVVNLTGYLQKTDMVPVTDAEIDGLF